MAKQKTRPAKLTTRVQIAKEWDVNERTVARWVSLDGFPKKTRGSWSSDDVDKFLRDRRLGPYKTGSHRVNGDTLTEATTRKTIEQAELARIAKERAIVDAKKELGELVEIEEVLTFYRQTVAVVTSVVEGFVAVKDRELPEAAPSSDAWPKIRARIMELDSKLLEDIAYAMRELSDYG